MENQPDCAANVGCHNKFIVGIVDSLANYACPKRHSDLVGLDGVESQDKVAVIDFWNKYSSLVGGTGHRELSTG